MTRWWQRSIGPYGIFLTVLVVLAVITLIAFVSWRPEPEIDERTGLLPFPPSQAEYYQLDDVAGHVHRPNTVREMDWPEHELGKVVLKTNNLGFRNDSPTELTKNPGTVRILITGDSHTDGVLYNSESVAARLEALLAAAHPDRRYEVLNGGTGHFGPQNYVGLLRRSLDLDLDHFIVVIFTGNDFLDAVAGAWARNQLEIPERPADYMERLAAANAVSSAAVSQGFNQIFFFRTFPRLVNTAVEITASACDEAATLCAEGGISFTVVLLPSLHDVEPERDSDTFHRVARTLGLEDDDPINRRMTRDLGARLREEGIAVVDPAERMAASKVPLFWLLDHHLSVAGHAALADAIFDARGDRLAAGADRRIEEKP